jgi:hypothetical protein
VGEHQVLIGEFDAEHGSRKHGDDLAFDINGFFGVHYKKLEMPRRLAAWQTRRKERAEPQRMKLRPQGWMVEV